MEEVAWAQFALVFWVAVCVFVAGAQKKRLPMYWRNRSEIVQAALIIVLLFGVLTEGRGCRAGAPTTDEDAVACSTDC